MRHFKTALLSCCAALLLSSLGGPAHAIMAGRFDQLSYMTFNQPVSLPGVTLPAGEYIFRLPERNTARMVLQVLSKDRSEVYAMVLTRPLVREEPTDQPTVWFHESSGRVPQAIRAWFYAGEKFGMEFAYPEHQARFIARHSNHPVLTTDLAYLD